jgi:hypothetical protein
MFCIWLEVILGKWDQSGYLSAARTGGEGGTCHPLIYGISHVHHLILLFPSILHEPYELHAELCLLVGSSLP